MVKFFEVPLSETNFFATSSLLHSVVKEITFFAVNPALIATILMTNFHFDHSLAISLLIIFQELIIFIQSNGEKIELKSINQEFIRV
tara:strand:- start:286 stop:546 length:261 start_codon:yes stop_codon:yes gene_type:complete